MLCNGNMKSALKYSLKVIQPLFTYQCQAIALHPSHANQGIYDRENFVASFPTHLIHVCVRKYPNTLQSYSISCISTIFNVKIVSENISLKHPWFVHPPPRRPHQVSHSQVQKSKFYHFF